MNSGLHDLKEHFGYLETEFGFTLDSFEYSAAMFGNFVALYSLDRHALRVYRDRGQVFVEMRIDDGEWKDKEPMLESLGVPFDRYPSVAVDEYGGLWTGYRIQNQSADLRRHLPILLEHMTAVGGSDC